MWCSITPEGQALHREAIPVAQARQAAAIRVLPREERDAMYRALLRLRAHCLEGDRRPGVDDLPGLDI